MNWTIDDESTLCMDGLIRATVGIAFLAVLGVACILWGLGFIGRALGRERP